MDLSLPRSPTRPSGWRPRCCSLLLLCVAAPAGCEFSRSPELEARGRAAARADSAPTEDELVRLGAGMIVPVQGVLHADLRDTYGEARGDRAHEALDIPAPRGTPVLSATDGRLLRLFDSKPGGLMVYATDASERFILYYGHLERYAPGLGDGMPLRRGQVIGYVGTTGNAPPGTPHLHFGIMRGDPRESWSKGAPVNPYPLLTARRR